MGPDPPDDAAELRDREYVESARARFGNGTAPAQNPYTAACRELFEACDFLGFLRAQALGPLALQLRGARPCGVRRLELLAPDLLAPFRSPFGEVVFGAAVVWMALGYRLLQRMAATPQEARVTLALEGER